MIAALLPQHQKLIEDSGIALNVAAARGYRSVTSRKELAGLGFPEYQQLVPALLIPVRDVNGAIATYQIRPDNPRTKKNGKVLKYETRVGTLMALDVPPAVRQQLADPNIPLFITEGARKADSAVSHGLCCISLLGVWNWRGTNDKGGKVALADWESIALNGRPVYIVFDSDVTLKPEVKAALDRLVPWLRKRDANVTVLYLPAAEGAKVGLDDYLAAGHAAEELMGLTAPVPTATATSSTSPLAFSVESSAASAGDVSVLDVLHKAGTIRRLHPAQDVIDGVLWYGSQVDDENLVLVNSSRFTCRPESLPADFKLRHEFPGRSRCIRPDVITAWLSGSGGSVAHVLDTLVAYFTGHIVLPAPELDGLMLAAWSLGTYCYKAFPAFPYVALTSPSRRCGKTTLLKLLARVGFNAGPVEVASSKTEASIFRQSGADGGLQFFDEADYLTGAPNEHSGNVIAVLNAGYEAEGTVSRTEKTDKGKFVQVRYEVYVPRVIAGLRGLADTLDDRAIKLTLMRRKPGEKFDDTLPEPEALTPIRDACVLACLTRISAIQDAYKPSKDLLRHERLDDRAVLLWAPLAALVIVADSEDEGNRLDRLLKAATAHAAVRASAEEDSGDVIARLLTLQAVCHGQPKLFTPDELLVLVGGTRSGLGQMGTAGKAGFEWVCSTKSLAAALNPLGFRNDQRRDGERRFRAYEITPAALADLFERHGRAAE